MRPLDGEPIAKQMRSSRFYSSLKGKDCDSALVFKARAVPCFNYVRNHARALLVRSYRSIFDSDRLDCTGSCGSSGADGVVHFHQQAILLMNGFQQMGASPVPEALQVLRVPGDGAARPTGPRSRPLRLRQTLTACCTSTLTTQRLTALSSLTTLGQSFLIPQTPRWRCSPRRARLPAETRFLDRTCRYLWAR